MENEDRNERCRCYPYLGLVRTIYSGPLLGFWLRMARISVTCFSCTVTKIWQMAFTILYIISALMMTKYDRTKTFAVEKFLPKILSTEVRTNKVTFPLIFCLSRHLIHNVVVYTAIVSVTMESLVHISIQFMYNPSDGCRFLVYSMGWGTGWDGLAN